MQNDSNNRFLNTKFMKARQFQLLHIKQGEASHQLGINFLLFITMMQKHKSFQTIAFSTKYNQICK